MNNIYYIYSWCIIPAHRDIDIFFHIIFFYLKKNKEKLYQKLVGGIAPTNSEPVQ